ncbi:hypothetical protein GIB67_031014, partial [Kingdonia uniflora]
TQRRNLWKHRCFRLHLKRNQHGSSFDFRELEETIVFRVRLRNDEARKKIERDLYQRVEYVYTSLRVACLLKHTKHFSYRET